MADQPVILASTSPRRRELLQRAGVAFEIVAAPVDEAAITAGLEPARAVVAAARAKVAAVNQPGRRILAADTAVICRGTVLGKPTSRVDAFRMLRAESGQAIEVITGVVLANGRTERADTVHSTVHLREINDDEIDAYLATGAGDDKAGALEVQGAAARFVTRIDGSVSNVYGLPVEVIEPWLR